MEQSHTPYTLSQPNESPPSATSTNGLAIASLVLSLLGLVGVLPVLGTILGLLFGYSAHKKIAESRGAQSGEGLAKTGIIIGWITVGLWILGFCMITIFLGFAFKQG